ncbi:MAG: hypothetical protein WCT29_01280 [Candidatus Paceibacterota bacterium]|jgi:hypothetical protein
MIQNNNNQKGISILGVLLLGVLLILALSYFNISIKAVVESPTTEDNLDYVRNGTKNLWTEYLEEPVTYVWEEIIIKIFWKPFISNLEHIRNGEPTDFYNAGGNLQMDY